MAEPMPMQHHLEIYMPGVKDVCALSETIDAPPAAFHVGEEIQVVNMEDEAEIDARISAVKHLVWKIKDSHVAQKVMVYTEELA